MTSSAYRRSSTSSLPVELASGTRKIHPSFGTLEPAEGAAHGAPAGAADKAHHHAHEWTGSRGQIVGAVAAGVRSCLGLEPHNLPNLRYRSSRALAGRPTVGTGGALPALQLAFCHAVIPRSCCQRAIPILKGLFRA